MIAAFTRPVIVARASNRKARIRAQRDPIFAPAGTGREEGYPRGSLVHQAMPGGPGYPSNAAEGEEQCGPTHQVGPKYSVHRTFCEPYVPVNPLITKLDGCVSAAEQGDTGRASRKDLHALPDA